MKKLSIEEKAKRYDEVINRMKHYVIDEYGCSRIKVADVFPELKESDDERIRGNIIATIHLYYGEPLEDEAKEMIAWLEKQGEQKIKTPEESLGIDSDTYNKIVDECIYGEQKPTWSEEDERNLQGIIDEIEANKNNAPDYDVATYNRFLSWLKSIKERYTWKPSDEQMNTLEYYIHNLICNEHKEVLFGLYADLKKLREEEVMKASEAPDKLYIDLFKGEFNVSYSPANNSIEYVHTDAFIEKAAKWLEDNAIEYWGTEAVDNGMMIDDFKKAMKL